MHTYTYTYITGQVKPSITEEAALEISKKARVLVFGNLPEDKTLQDGTSFTLIQYLIYYLCSATSPKTRPCKTVCHSYSI